jgi:DNA-binding CsgD family transcriptional regulator
MTAHRDWPEVPNPWGVTAAEAACLDAFAEQGAHKLVARELGLSVKTVETYCMRAYSRLGCSGLKAIVRWDRHRRPAAAQGDLA